jgi:hypothetical protein
MHKGKTRHARAHIVTRHNHPAGSPVRGLARLNQDQATGAGTDGPIWKEQHCRRNNAYARTISGRPGCLVGDYWLEATRQPLPSRDLYPILSVSTKYLARLYLVETSTPFWVEAAAASTGRLQGRDYYVPGATGSTVRGHEA